MFLIMKKIILPLFMLLIPSLFFAKDIKVKVSSLPSGIVSFVTKYYPSAKILSASQENDDKDYNLKLSNGTELEFNQNSEWIEIKTRSKIPAGILPQEISDYVKKVYPGKAVKSIEHSKSGYDIRLNGNKKFQLDNSFKPTTFKEDND